MKNGYIIMNIRKEIRVRLLNRLFYIRTKMYDIQRISQQRCMSCCIWLMLSVHGVKWNLSTFDIIFIFLNYGRAKKEVFHNTHLCAQKNLIWSIQWVYNIIWKFCQVIIIVSVYSTHFCKWTELKPLYVCYLDLKNLCW